MYVSVHFALIIIYASREFSMLIQTGSALLILSNIILAFIIIIDAMS